MGGCVTCNDVIVEFDETQETLDLPPKQNTDTYDPGNMSITRESHMAGYQFTKRAKNGIRSKPNEHITHQLPTISDTALNSPNLSQIPRKRVVFVSLRSLNASIDSIPSYILEESLFCFKAERAWFFPSNAKEKILSKKSIRHRSNFNELFLKYLSKKDKNNHVLWMEESKTWKDISNEITKINDIYLNKYYQPLQLNRSWWIHNSEEQTDRIQSLYCHSGDVVMEEILECRLKFNPTMELLYQSNPTLIPMKGFDIEMYANQHYKEEEKEVPMKVSDLGVDVESDAGEQVATLKDNDSAQAYNMVKIDDAGGMYKEDPITPFNDQFDGDGVYNHKSNSKQTYIEEEDDQNTENVYSDHKLCDEES